MKLNKILLFAAASLGLLAGCDDSDSNVDPAPVKDSIEITPETATVSSKGGNASVMVTSSGTWTLSGAENDFVTPSATSGKDGDIVVFNVKANDQEKDQSFIYTFTCGKEEAPFVLTLKKKASEVEPELEIFYAEGTNMLPVEGGKVTVLVTSSATWSLEGSYSFVTPSATSGEDGATVEFEVAPNETYEQLTADYLFTLGNKQVPFQIVVEAAVPELLEITSATEMRLSYKQEERVAVTLNTDVNYRDLTAEIVSETEGWLTYAIARPTEGGSENNVTAYFSMAENSGETAREATVTIKGVKTGAATLKITQLPQSKITPEERAYFLYVEAQKLVIPTEANVEFDTQITEGNEWITFVSYADNALTFDIAALPEEEAARVGAVTLTEKNPADNAEPVVVTISISQKPKGLIEQVADMRYSRCYFQNAPANADVLNNLSSGTMEALVNIQETRKDGSLSTIMGVEGKFLLRMGDAGIAWNQIQFASPRGNYTSASKLKLTETNRWYHIAITWDSPSQRLYFYIDGEPVYNDSFWGTMTANFGVGYTGYESEYGRAFWIGYAYNADRWFPGYMAECRVWNRALTKAEIQAENHFYSVDPASEGLVGYWKLNGPMEGGRDYDIEDCSPSGNHMVCEHDVVSNGNTQTGPFGINWVKTSLP